MTRPRMSACSSGLADDFAQYYLGAFARPLTRRQYADALAVAAGRPHYVRGPGRMLRWGGAQAALLLRSQRVSNRRFREAAGWAPRWRGADEGLGGLAGVGPAPGGPGGPSAGRGAPV